MEKENGFLQLGTAQNVAIPILWPLIRSYTRLVANLTMIHLKKNVQSVILAWQDFIDILILSMANSTGFQWDGIAQDASMFGWIKKQKKPKIKQIDLFPWGSGYFLLFPPHLFYLDRLYQSQSVLLCCKRYAEVIRTPVVFLLFYQTHL